MVNSVIFSSLSSYAHIVREDEKIIYPSELFFFLYVLLNLPYVARLCASNLVKENK